VNKLPVKEEDESIERHEKGKFVKSFLIPFSFVFILWLVRLLQIIVDDRFIWLGVYPKHIKGLIGILTSPLVHSGWDHLISNTLPLLILGTALFYFYKELALKSFLLIYLLAGLWVWFGGREVWHIGASGIIYGLSSFLFFSGLIRRAIDLMAISLVVVFLYGGLVWGLFPIVENMSWESHLSGGLAGLVLAFYYKDHGPQRKRFDWEDEEEHEEDEIDTGEKEPFDEGEWKYRF
jgi:membrane associated rhomboid family serine protease